MPNLKIIKSGLMTSIQDLGRRGLAYYAIPRSGVMDKESAIQALDLLNQTSDTPLIECTSIAPHIQFNGATQIAITGADFQWTINNKSVPRNAVIDIRVGDILKGKIAKQGLRAYIAINARLNIKAVYSSFSTYTNAKIGGYKGRLLQAGDVIEYTKNNRVKSVSYPPFSIPKKHIIPIKCGPEFDYLSTVSKQLLTNTTYKIDTASNRMGLRLVGKPLESLTYQLQSSLPILPGFIQLPPSGLPIVILQDGQISGGYPRIAYVPEKYLSKLNQIPLGVAFRFGLS